MSHPAYSILLPGAADLLAENIQAVSGAVSGTGVVSASLSATPAGGATSALAFWLGNVGAEATGAVVGTVFGTGVLSGTITVDARLSGSVVGTGVVSATGTFDASLVATTFGIGVVAASATFDARLVGAAVGTGVLSATGTFDAYLSAAASGTGVVAASMDAAASIAAAASGTGIVAASITADAFLAGAVTGTGVVAGSLTADAYLAAAVFGLGIVAAEITVIGEPGAMIGSVVGTGIVSAGLDVAAALSCTTAGTGAISCSLTADAALSGEVTGTGNAAGAITVSAILSGTAFGTGGVSATTNVPEDPDVLSVTARTDTDGATIRPIRPVFYHAADSSLEADFTGFDRSFRIDRHYQRSSRSFRTINVGNRFDVGFDAVRAGEAFALQRFVAWVSPEAERPRAASNSNRTDAAGASVSVPEFFMLLSAATARDGALSTLGATVQDRWVARFAVPSSQGHGSRYEIDLCTDGRGGTAFAIDRIVCEVSAEGARLRETDNTDRTDDVGATIGVQSFRFVVAADGAREADTETLDAFVTGRWNAAFAVPSAQGLGQFYELELGSLGRASHAFAIDRLVCMVSDAAEARPGDET